MVNSNLKRIESPWSIRTLFILLNQRCNFACSYCYSAHGRSSAELSERQLKTILDFYVNKNRGKRLSIIFSGGGDPTLSFARLKYAIEYAKQLAQREAIELYIDMVTNGSSLDDSQIRFIKEHGLGLVVSFDIIKEIHNAQRSGYETVVETLRRLEANGVNPGIRSTITPLNVCRMMEMVEHLHTLFPKIESIGMEAVLDRSTFGSVEVLEQFYSDFVNNYFLAKERGKELGVFIGNSEEANASRKRERACAGNLVVGPDGSLTACSRVSSPKETLYGDFVFGKVSEEEVYIDNSRYDSIMSDNVYSHPECYDCSARWYCGGGCRLARLSYNKDWFAAHCKFVRTMNSKAQSSM